MLHNNIIFIVLIVFQRFHKQFSDFKAKNEVVSL